MDYKVMKRPMFRVGGPTSGGTGITSGLDTPKRGLVDGPGKYSQPLSSSFDLSDLFKQRTAAYDKMGSSIDKQRSQLGGMALMGMDFSDVNSIGDLAMSLGSDQNRAMIMKGLSKMPEIDLMKDKLNLSKTESDITTGLALKKMEQGKKYEFKAKLAEFDSNNTLMDNIVTKAGGLEKLREEGNESLLKEYTRLEDKNNFILRAMSELEFVLQGLLKDEDAYTEALMEKYREAKTKVSGNAEGGRINKQMGGGFDMAQAPQAVSQETQMMQPQKDPYMILREKLPPEIPNEVVQLIAYNKEAFEDFANIQTQDDVDLFNQKYNVQLVVDMASA